jgi:hypothetical protein
VTATARRWAQRESFTLRLRNAALTALGAWTAAVRERVAADTSTLPDTSVPAGMAHLWRDLLTEHLGRELTGGIDGTIAAELLGTGVPVTEPSPWAERYVAGAASRWASMPAVTTTVLSRALADAMRDGSDPRDRVLFELDSDDNWTPHAERIARTEATAATNGALLAAWTRRDAALGSVTHKRWVAAESGAREAHAGADGQTQPLDARFLVDDEQLAHPGDPTAPAGATTYCRCLLDDVLVEPGRGQAALTAAATDRDAAAAAEGDTTMTKARTWSGLLAPFGVNSGDRRRLKAGGEFSFRDLPLPLMFQEATGSGHNNAVVVGRILSIDVTDKGYEASGDYLVGEEFEKDVNRAIALADQDLGHVSVDLSEVVGEMSDADGNPITEEDYIEAWLTGKPLEVYDQFTAAKLIGVTQVAKPAFGEAMIKLDAEEALVADGGDPAEAQAQDEAQGAGEVQELAAETVAEAGAEGAEDAPGQDAQGEDEAAAVVAEAEIVAEAEAIVETAAAQVESLRAAAGQAGAWRPDAEVFANPQLKQLTPMTIGPADSDGYRRVYGHLAGWTTCHIGYANTCVTPPKEDSFDYFHVGEVECADGTPLPVGNLTLGGRHADPTVAFREAVDHYDDSGAGAAVLRAYPDEFGIAVSGVITPETTEAQIAQLRRSVLSGDWRRVGGRMRLVGALAVNTGGFPVPRYAFDDHGRQMSLVAAGSVPQALRVEESYEDVARRVFAEEAQKAERRAEVAALVDATLAEAFAAELDDLLSGVDL